VPGQENMHDGWRIVLHSSTTFCSTCDLRRCLEVCDRRVVELKGQSELFYFNDIEKLRNRYQMCSDKGDKDIGK